MRHCERDALSTRVANVPALRGKEGEQAQIEVVRIVPLIEHQLAGAGEASFTPADESDAASLPTGSGEKLDAQMEE